MLTICADRAVDCWFLLLPLIGVGVRFLTNSAHRDMMYSSLFLHSATSAVSTFVLLNVSVLLQQNGVAAPPVVLRRQIRYIRADNNGIFISHRWGTLEFDGRSLLDLIANLTDDEAGHQFNNITLCVRAGFLGRITPLVVNLPSSEETMDIVVFTTGSAGESFACSFFSILFRVTASTSSIYR